MVGDGCLLLIQPGGAGGYTRSNTDNPKCKKPGIREAEMVRHLRPVLTPGLIAVALLQEKGVMLRLVVHFSTKQGTEAPRPPP